MVRIRIEVRTHVYSWRSRRVFRVLEETQQKKKKKDKKGALLKPTRELPGITISGLFYLTRELKI